MYETPPLPLGNRVPIPFTDQRGIACLCVPLDDESKTFARIERSDFDYIVRGLGCRAQWYFGGTRGRRSYVRVNVPHVEGREGGHFLVVRLFPGVGPEHRVRYATADTLDLRRCNLTVELIQDGRSLDGGVLVSQAVKKRRTNAVRKRPRRSLNI